MQQFLKLIKDWWTDLREQNLAAFCVLVFVLWASSLALSVLVSDIKRGLFVKIIFSLIALGIIVFLFLIDLRKEKTSTGAKYSFWWSWILCVFSMMVYFAFCQYESLKNSKLNHQYWQATNDISDLRQELDRDEFEIDSAVHAGRTEAGGTIYEADIFVWAALASFPGNYANCKYFFDAANERAISDEDYAQHYPLYAFSVYKLDQSPDAFNDFKTNLDGFFDNMRKHQGDTNLNEYLSQKDSLVACSNSLARILVLLPQQDQEYIHEKILTLGKLESFCNH